MSGFVSEQVFFLIGLTGETQVMIACVLNGLFHCIFRGRLFRKEDSLFLFSGGGNFLCIWKCGSDDICNVRFAHAAHHAVDADNIFIHELCPCFCGNFAVRIDIPGHWAEQEVHRGGEKDDCDAVPDMPIPVMDFLMDTTRAFTNMVWNDKFLKYPNIQWIWPHGSSFITILSDRFNSFSVQVKKNGSDKKLDYFGALKHCYFDTAGFSAPKQIHDMKMDIPTSHFLYGSVCPYTPSIACVALDGQLEKTPELTSAEKKKMFTTNGYALIPGLEESLKRTKFPVADRAKRSALGSVMNEFGKISRRK